MKELDKEIKKHQATIEHYSYMLENSFGVSKEIIKDTLIRTQERYYGLCKAKELIEKELKNKKS